MSALRTTTTTATRTLARAASIRPALSVIASRRHLSLAAHAPLVTRTRTAAATGTTPSFTHSLRFKSTGTPWGPPVVTYDELEPLTRQPNDDVLVVDVREPDEQALGTIPSSVSLPLSVLKDHLASTFDESTFVRDHMFRKPDPSQKMIFYCRSGKRSATAAQQAQQAGYPNVRNYEGSWLDWKKREEENKNKSEDDD